MMNIKMATLLLAVLSGALADIGRAQETAAKTYTNPVIDEVGPADPCVMLHDGRYYLYCTGDNRSYHVYYSADLVNWTKGPSAA